MDELKTFNDSEFGELGVLEIDGKEYFPATSCAKILGYRNPRKAIIDHCREDGVTKRDAWVQTGIKSDGSPAMRKNEINYIDEGNLYRLIVHSKLPSAERFECWVFDEVLPSIRKQGGYAPDLTELIQKTVSETVKEVVKQLVPAITAIISSAVTQKPTEEPAFAKMPTEYCPVQKCKLETFPEDLVERVNYMLEDMKRQQAVNFSMIARFCTMSGYSISSPSVKRYFDRHFSEQED